MFTAAVLLLSSLRPVVSYDSSFNVNLGKKYVSFSGAAYCSDPRFKKSGVEQWSCSACKSYPGMQATVFNSYKDGVGYVGYYPPDNEIVVAFSGTNPFDIQQWIDDLDFIKKAYPYCSGCEVHEGFYKTYLTIADTVRNLTKSYLSAHPTASVTCTGHSLGAALAAHCFADLKANNIASKLSTPYTFGMPRVGNEAFEKWYVSTLPGTFRMSHHKDPVPHLPFESWGFHHMAYEVFYTDDYNKYKVCNFEGEDSSCANQYTVALDVVHHLHYLDMDFTTNWINCEL